MLVLSTDTISHLFPGHILMTEFVRAEVQGHIGFLTLDRPKALNSLSLEMIRAITQFLTTWQADDAIVAVVLRSSSEKAFCAGGDIRFFHRVAQCTPRGGSALLEDFFTEEYALNHLIHHYTKPYVVFMDGIVMGGGMGISRTGPQSRLCIVTERTRLAMPEVHIGIFPDVGGSYFLSRAPGEIGTWLGVAGEVIGPADALVAGLADLYVQSNRLPALTAMLAEWDGVDLPAAIRAFASPDGARPVAGPSLLAEARESIDRHFSQQSVQAIVTSLASDPTDFAQKTLATMQQGSPLLMCVTLEQLRRGRHLDVAHCLRMERDLVRRCFEHADALEGIRARVIDKDNAPRWSPATLQEVTTEMVEAFFEPVWPAWAHPLRHLQ
jgi:enoyl-CoA hydratase/carnithine racemase